MTLESSVATTQPVQTPATPRPPSSFDGIWRSLALHVEDMLDIAIALLTAALCSKCLLELPSIFPQKNPRLTHFLSLYTWPQKGPVKVLDEFCDFFSLSPLTNWEQGPSLPGKRGVGLDGPMAHGFGFLLRVSLQHAHPLPFSTEEGLPRDCLYNFDQIYMGGCITACQLREQFHAGAS